DGQAAKWLSDDTRHMLAELTPKPDQVTIAINTTQMNFMEMWEESDSAGTSLAEPDMRASYKELLSPAGPTWMEEHLRRLSAAGIEPHFQLGNTAHLHTVERMIRRGIYKGAVNITWNAISSGFDSPNPFDMMNFIRACPNGTSVTTETAMRNVLP